MQRPNGTVPFADPPLYTTYWGAGPSNPNGFIERDVPNFSQLPLNGRFDVPLTSSSSSIPIFKAEWPPTLVEKRIPIARPTADPVVVQDIIPDRKISGNWIALGVACFAVGCGVWYYVRHRRLASKRQPAEETKEVEPSAPQTSIVHSTHEKPSMGVSPDRDDDWVSISNASCPNSMPSSMRLRATSASASPTPCVAPLIGCSLSDDDSFSGRPSFNRRAFVLPPAQRPGEADLSVDNDSEVISPVAENPSTAHRLGWTSV